MAGGANRSAPLADVFQLPDPTTLTVKNQDVAVSEVKLPRPPLLRGVECGEGQLSDP
jgi:hypothetical protein